MRQPSYEQALKKMGVEFEYAAFIKSEEINYTRGRQLQARLERRSSIVLDVKPRRVFLLHRSRNRLTLFQRLLDLGNVVLARWWMTILFLVIRRVFLARHLMR